MKAIITTKTGLNTYEGVGLLRQEDEKDGQILLLDDKGNYFASFDNEEILVIQITP